MRVLSCCKDRINMEHVKPSFKSTYNTKVHQISLIGNSLEICDFFCLLSKPRSSIDMNSEILAMYNIKWHNTSFKCPLSIHSLQNATDRQTLAISFIGKISFNAKFALYSVSVQLTFVLRILMRYLLFKSHL